MQNVHTMDELRLTGNHLKSSRPLLTFNKAFDEQPHLALIKEMLKQVHTTRLQEMRGHETQPKRIPSEYLSH